jgi:predicted amidohydrolase
MPRKLRVAAVQAAPLDSGRAVGRFTADVATLLAEDPTIEFLVFPELHLFGSTGTREESDEQLRRAAIPLGGELIAQLARIAGKHGIWLIPGSVCERDSDGRYYNTAVVFSPSGRLEASYRKIFPWRPYEFHTPGTQFVTFDIPKTGRIGLSICYDAWFPEVTRQLAWMGAELIINVVKTTTADRSQEVLLAQANSIVNQTFTVSVNCAGPSGRGQSLIVDPEGAVLQATSDAVATVLTQTIDLGRVARVREAGTLGLNRMWSQFHPSDPPIELPIYQGRMDPASWVPQPNRPLVG